MAHNIESILTTQANDLTLQSQNKEQYWPIMSEAAQQTALVKAIYKVLRPMVRLLMRHGVSYRLFAEVARHVYVDVAEEDFCLPGRKASHARTAVLTGINRKDIAKLKARPHPLTAGSAESTTPAARVITGWLNDARFQDATGAPRELPMEGLAQQPGFSELVKEYSSDVPARALLDELERINAVECNEQGVRLAVRAYIPVANVQESMRILGTAAADLLRTMDHNIERQAPGPFLQRTVSYNDIPAELLPEIRHRARTEGEAFLLQTNEWLARCDRQENADLVGSGRFRAGIGIYYLEMPLDDTEQPQ